MVLCDEGKVSMIVTIDGPAGSGKSSVAKQVAAEINAAFLDTGAMYRAVTLAAMKKQTDLTDEDAILAVLNGTTFNFAIADHGMTVTIDGEDVTDEIRKPYVTSQVKHAASAVKVRRKLVDMQREFASSHPRIVTEGRDQGTVAFPDADFKFFLTADAAERARRRLKDLHAAGQQVDVEQLQKDIEKRDASDQSRKEGPLKPAPDAIIIDTTNLDLNGVVKAIVKHIPTTAHRA